MENIKGYDFKSLSERLNSEEYSKVFISELISCDSRKAFMLYLGSLRRNNIITFEDLLSKDVDELLKLRGISMDVLHGISDKLQSLGVTLFCIKTEKEVYRDMVVNAKSSEEALDVLFSILRKRGYSNLVDTYNQCWKLKGGN